MVSLIGQVKNGNYIMQLWSDGTKIRYNNLDYFEPENVESIDLKITNRCYGVNGTLCSMCHEGSSPHGEHADIMNLKFIDTMLPYSEVAIGGGDVLLHPDLIPFLEKLKEQKLIANITVRQNRFMDSQALLHYLVDKELIRGLGVSVSTPTDEFIKEAKEYKNLVAHVINGIVGIDALKKLSYNNLKILILGYKQFRRGETLYNMLGNVIESKKIILYNILPKIVRDGWFKCVSFDNLAIEQLNPKRFMSEDEWQRFFMGTDGSYTFYVDAVNQEFAISSTSTVRYPIEDDAKIMFNKIRSM